MKDRAVGFVEVSMARDTLKLTPRLAARVTMDADVAPSKPAVIRAIRIGTEVRSGVDSVSASSGEVNEGGEPGALERESAPCSRASHSGLWISPIKGLGSLERLRRR